MAVVQVNEITNREHTRDKLAVKRYTRTFQVLTDAPTDGARVVHDNVGLPNYGDIWIDTLGGDSDPDAFMVEKRPAQNDADNFQNWTVTCEYVGRGDPTLEPARLSFATVKYQKAIQKDITDRWIANSAGDPFEGGLTVDRGRFSILIEQNVLTFDPVDAQNYLETLNVGFFLGRYAPGFPPGTCKMSEINADAVWFEDRSDIHFYKRQTRIEVDLDGWRPVLLDAGFRQIVAGNRAAIFDEVSGAKTSVPVPLDGSGVKLAVGGTPVYLAPFDVYETTDWSALGLEV